jgi:hypothetical protein
VCKNRKSLGEVSEVPPKKKRRKTKRVALWPNRGVTEPAPRPQGWFDNPFLPYLEVDKPRYGHLEGYFKKIKIKIEGWVLKTVSFFFNIYKDIFVLLKKKLSFFVFCFFFVFLLALRDIDFF